MWREELNFLIYFQIDVGPTFKSFGNFWRITMVDWCKNYLKLSCEKNPPTFIPCPIAFVYSSTANPFPVMTTGISPCSNSHREFPVMNTGSMQSEEGFPVKKIGFSLWEFTTQGKPCSGHVLALHWPCTGLQWESRVITIDALF